MGYQLHPPLEKHTWLAKHNKATGTCSYIINLNRSKQKLHFVLPKVRALGFPLTRIQAIDGNTLTWHDITEHVDLITWEKIGDLPNKGTIGCYLSHLKAWKTFLKSNYQFALIFEDDVAFNPATLKSVLRQLRNHSEQWDIVGFNLSHSFPALNLFRVDDRHHVVIYLTHIVNAGAYLINKKAAQHLIRLALLMKQPVDEYFTRGWELDLKFLGVEPRLVIQAKARLPSDIEKSQPLPQSHFLFDGNTLNKPQQLKKQESFSHHFIRKSIEYQTKLIHFCYNLKLYLSIKTQPLLGTF